MKTHFDVIVIGAGSGGLTAAVGLSKVGKSVLLVEREHLGGECTNSGCIPSKALLHHAKTYHNAVSIAGTTDATEHYRTQAFTYVRSKINEVLSHESPEYFKSIGITVVMGEAEFTSPTTIQVNATAYTFGKAIIATGSSPRMLPVPGLHREHILTNQNLFTLQSVPARTLIVGAGPIGLEMGQALALLGSTVSILDNGPTFAKLEDPALQPLIKQACLNLGITIIQSATINQVTSGNIAVVDQEGSQTVSIPFDKILFAVGRVPNIPQGLTTAEIASTELGVTVNRNYQTTNKRVYALGDVADRFKFTHMADHVARGVVGHIVSHGLLGVKITSIPKVTYTEPEIAQVGLSDSEARTQCGDKRIHRIEVSFENNDRARTDDETTGLLVVIVERLTGKILGAHILGPRAGELLAVFSLAIDNRLSLWTLRATMYAYPTYALIIKKAGDVFFATQISTLRTDLKQKAFSWAPKLLLVGIWLIGLYMLYHYTHASGLTASAIAVMIFNFITETPWGPVLYMLAYTVRPLTFFPGTALTILSGVFFGLWGGIIYTIIGANLSATLAYFIGRFFGGKSANQSVGIFGRFAEACRKQPFLSILTMRLLFLPYDAVNYGAGLLRVPFVPYIVATIIGSILGIATFVAVGASISVEEFTRNGITADVINGQFLVISALIFVASLGIAKFLQKK